ncbi:MAG: hypothetical protein AAF438_08970 [Pseudomonadota bacterium]
MSNKAMWLIMFFAVSVAGGLGFIMGNFMSSYGNNLCYSALVSNLSDQAIEAMESLDQQTIDSFVQKVNALPNHGNESSCNEMQRVLSQ